MAHPVVILSVGCVLVAAIHRLSVQYLVLDHLVQPWGVWPRESQALTSLHAGTLLCSSLLPPNSAAVPLPTTNPHSPPHHHNITATTTNSSPPPPRPYQPHHPDTCTPRLTHHPTPHTCSPTHLSNAVPGVLDAAVSFTPEMPRWRRRLEQKRAYFI
ncbi:hypothetical protein E2C01_066607 [Portunus trituberculatus]|uniref:Uncharacterized protein n=1 Tax=Portunus trituberculatus TaxID=210409 RepID=A0A5B7HQY5_PORTR|nr:hypothetical protein [Portunus trituberculatus]